MQNFITNIKKNNNIDFINFATSIANIYAPIKYSPNQKFDNYYFIFCLVDFFQNNVSWSKYKGTPLYPIDGKYLNQIHNKFVRLNVYEEINKAVLTCYLKNGREDKLKYQIIDSSFVPNKGGSVNNTANNDLLSDDVKKKNSIIRKNNKKQELESESKRPQKEETFIDFNRYNGRKKYLKVSSVTDSKGTPLVSIPVSAKQSDNISLIETVNKIPINLNTLNNSKINRYQQYFLADTGYCSETNRSFLEEKGYIPLIAFNKRNCKDPKIIQENKLKGDDLARYKKRFIIEPFFSWIKNYPVLNQNYQKTISSYNGLLLLASSLIVFKRI
jgi:hypothetical protein